MNRTIECNEVRHGRCKSYGFDGETGDRFECSCLCHLPSEDDIKTIQDIDRLETEILWGRKSWLNP